MTIISDQVKFEESIKRLPNEIQNKIYYDVLSINKLKLCELIKNRIKYINFAIKFKLRIKLNKVDYFLIKSLSKNNSLQIITHNNKLGSTKDIKIANVLIRNRFKNANILDIKIKVDHDGYDKYGPKSDLVDLFVHYEKKNEIYVDEFYWENYWTKSCLKQEFQFLKKNKINNKNFNFKNF